MLALPVLVYVLDQPVADATTTSLLVVAAGALVGAARHARARRVCWRHAVSFTAAALPGIVVGTLIGDAIGSDLLLLAFAAVMLIAAYATWGAPIRTMRRTTATGSPEAHARRCGCRATSSPAPAWGW